MSSKKVAKIPKYSCLPCHDKFNNIKQYNDHVKLHQDSSNKPQKNLILCQYPLCNTVFGDQESLQQHLISHGDCLSSAAKSEVQENVDGGDKTKSLKRKKSTTFEEPESATLGQGTVQTGTKKQSGIGMAIHSLIKSNIARRKKQKLDSSLKIMTSHLPESIHQVICPHCNIKMFAPMSLCLIHIQKHGQESVSTKKMPNPFVCMYTNNRLSSHCKAKTLTFACADCQATFASYKLLAEHAKVHVGTNKPKIIAEVQTKCGEKNSCHLPNTSNTSTQQEHVHVDHDSASSIKKQPMLVQDISIIDCSQPVAHMGVKEKPIDLILVATTSTEMGVQMPQAIAQVKYGENNTCSLPNTPTASTQQELSHDDYDSASLPKKLPVNVQGTSIIDCRQPVEQTDIKEKPIDLTLLTTSSTQTGGENPHPIPEDTSTSMPSSEQPSKKEVNCTEESPKKSSLHKFTCNYGTCSFETFSQWEYRVHKYNIHPTVSATQSAPPVILKIPDVTSRAFNKGTKQTVPSSNKSAELSLKDFSQSDPAFNMASVGQQNVSGSLFKCNVCCIEFNNYDTFYKTHMEQIKGSSQKRYATSASLACVHCMRNFPAYYLYMNHMQSHMTTVSKPLSPSHPSKSHPAITSPITSMPCDKQHAVEEPLHCEKCNQRCSTHAELQKHQQMCYGISSQSQQNGLSTPSETQPTICCKPCLAAFENKDLYYAHMTSENHKQDSITFFVRKLAELKRTLRHNFIPYFTGTQHCTSCNKSFERIDTHHEHMISNDHLQKSEEYYSDLQNLSQFNLCSKMRKSLTVRQQLGLIARDNERKRLGQIVQKQFELSENGATVPETEDEHEGTECKSRRLELVSDGDGISRWVVVAPTEKPEVVDSTKSTAVINKPIITALLQSSRNNDLEIGQGNQKRPMTGLLNILDNIESFRGFASQSKHSYQPNVIHATSKQSTQSLREAAIDKSSVGSILGSSSSSNQSSTIVTEPITSSAPTTTTIKSEPVKPLFAFAKFYNSMWLTKKNNCTKTIENIGYLIADKWDTISLEEKAALQRQYEEDLAIYEEEMKSYKEFLNRYRYRPQERSISNVKQAEDTTSIKTNFHIKDNSNSITQNKETNIQNKETSTSRENLIATNNSTLNSGEKESAEVAVCVVNETAFGSENKNQTNTSTKQFKEMLNLEDDNVSKNNISDETTTNTSNDGLQRTCLETVNPCPPCKVPISNVDVTVSLENAIDLVKSADTCALPTVQYGSAPGQKLSDGLVVLDLSYADNEQRTTIGKDVPEPMDIINSGKVPDTGDDIDDDVIPIDIECKKPVEVIDLTDEESNERIVQMSVKTLGPMDVLVPPVSPETAFQRFNRDVYLGIQQDNDELSYLDVKRIVRNIWRVLPLDTRQAYQTQYEQNMEKHNKLLLEYHKALNERGFQNRDTNKTSAFAASTPALVSLVSSYNVMPKAPDPPLTPYTRFYQSGILDRVKKNYPNTSGWELNKIVASMWKNMSPQLKTAYTMDYEIKKVGYEEALSKYHNSSSYQLWLQTQARAGTVNPSKHGSEHGRHFHQEHQQHKLSDTMLLQPHWQPGVKSPVSQSNLRKKPDKLKGAKRKKPLSPYMRFSSKVYRQLKADNPHLTFTELGKLIGQMWRELPHEVSEKYKDAYKADRVLYQQESINKADQLLREPPSLEADKYQNTYKANTLVHQHVTVGSNKLEMPTDTVQSISHDIWMQYYNNARGPIVSKSIPVTTAVRPVTPVIPNELPIRMDVPVSPSFQQKVPDMSHPHNIIVAPSPQDSNNGASQVVNYGDFTPRDAMLELDRLFAVAKIPKPSSSGDLSTEYVNKESYKCGYCGQVLHSQVLYVDHCGQHTQEHANTCTKCHRHFSDQTSLQQHADTHVMNNEVESIPNSEKKQFLSLLPSHPLYNKQNTNNFYLCIYCLKAIKISELQQHQESCGIIVDIAGNADDIEDELSNHDSQGKTNPNLEDNVKSQSPFTSNHIDCEIGDTVGENEVVSRWEVAPGSSNTLFPVKYHINGSDTAISQAMVSDSKQNVGKEFSETCGAENIPTLSRTATLGNYSESNKDPNVTACKQKCQHCDEIIHFNDMMQLSLHISNCLKTRKVLCPYCKSSYFYESTFQLKMHLATCRGEKAATEANMLTSNIHHCDYCNLSYESRATLQMHVDFHTIEELESSKPQEKGPNKTSYKHVHRGSSGKVTPVDSSPAPLKCPHCNLNVFFDEVQDLKMHLATCIDSVTKKHMYKENSSQERNVCEYCNVDLRTRAELEKHVFRHSLDTLMKSFNCKDCDQQFRYEKGLISHRRGHEKEFREMSGNKVSDKTWLGANHLQITSVQGGVSAAPDIISEPIEDLDSTASFMLCPHCDTNFCYNIEEELKIHLATCRAMDDEKKKKQNVLLASYYGACELCDAYFTTKENLVDHIAGHTVAELLMCKICISCNQRFRHEHNLVKHRSLKHGFQVLESQKEAKEVGNTSSTNEVVPLHCTLPLGYGIIPTPSVTRKTKHHVSCSHCDIEVYYNRDVDLRMHLATCVAKNPEKLLERENDKKTRKYVCQVCDSQNRDIWFENFKDMRTHSNSHTITNLLMVKSCKLCDNRFRTPKQLVEHTNKWQGHCKKKMNEIMSRISRISVKLIGDSIVDPALKDDTVKTKSMICQHCNLNIMYCLVEDLKYHLAICIPEWQGDKPNDVCQICRVQLSEKSEMWNHAQTHLLNDLMTTRRLVFWATENCHNLKCNNTTMQKAVARQSICGGAVQEEASTSSKSKRLAPDDSSNPKRFKACVSPTNKQNTSDCFFDNPSDCEHCKTALLSMRRNTENPHECRFCQAVIPSSIELRKHERAHSTVHICLICWECNSRHSNQEELNKHILTHVKDFSFKSNLLICDICGHTEIKANAESFAYHAKTHEGVHSADCHLETGQLEDSPVVRTNETQVVNNTSTVEPISSNTIPSNDEKENELEISSKVVPEDVNAVPTSDGQELKLGDEAKNRRRRVNISDNSATVDHQTSENVSKYQNISIHYKSTVTPSEITDHNTCMSNIAINAHSSNHIDGRKCVDDACDQDRFTDTNDYVKNTPTIHVTTDTDVETDNGKGPRCSLVDLEHNYHKSPRRDSTLKAIEDHNYHKSPIWNNWAQMKIDSHIEDKLEHTIVLSNSRKYFEMPTTHSRVQDQSDQTDLAGVVSNRNIDNGQVRMRQLDGNSVREKDNTNSEEVGGSRFNDSNELVKVSDHITTKRLAMDHNYSKVLFEEPSSEIVPKKCIADNLKKVDDDQNCNNDKVKSFNDSLAKQTHIENISDICKGREREPFSHANQNLPLPKKQARIDSQITDQRKWVFIDKVLKDKCDKNRSDKSESNGMLGVDDCKSPLIVDPIELNQECERCNKSVINDQPTDNSEDKLDVSTVDEKNFQSTLKALEKHSRIQSNKNIYIAPVESNSDCQSLVAQDIDYDDISGPDDVDSSANDDVIGLDSDSMIDKKDLGIIENDPKLVSSTCESHTITVHDTKPKCLFCRHNHDITEECIKVGVATTEPVCPFCSKKHGIHLRCDTMVKYLNRYQTDELSVSKVVTSAAVFQSSLRTHVSQSTPCVQLQQSTCRQDVALPKVLNGKESDVQLKEDNNYIDNIIRSEVNEPSVWHAKSASNVHVYRKQGGYHTHRSRNTSSGPFGGADGQLEGIAAGSSWDPSVVFIDPEPHKDHGDIRCPFCYDNHDRSHVCYQTVVYLATFGKFEPMKVGDGHRAKFMCPVCYDDFPWDYNCRTHTFTRHIQVLQASDVTISVKPGPVPLKIGEDKFLCPLCQTTYASHQGCRSHLRVCQGTEDGTNTTDSPPPWKSKKPRYRCPFCPEVHTRPYNCRYHVQKQHTRFAKPDDPNEPVKFGHQCYMCPFCSREFPRETSCKKHIEWNHRSQDMLVCDTCRRAYYKYKAHECLALPIKIKNSQYRCPYCPHKVFTRCYNCATHIREKHGGLSAPQSNCNYKQSMNSNGLASVGQVAPSTGITYRLPSNDNQVGWQKNATRYSKCSECGVTYKGLNHRCFHSKCPHCNINFKLRSELIKHILCQHKLPVPTYNNKETPTSSKEGKNSNIEAEPDMDNLITADYCDEQIEEEFMELEESEEEVLSKTSKVSSQEDHGELPTSEQYSTCAECGVTYKGINHRCFYSKCPHCNTNFQLRSELMKHILSQHKLPVTAYENKIGSTREETTTVNNEVEQDKEMDYLIAAADYYDEQIEEGFLESEEGKAKEASRTLEEPVLRHKDQLLIENVSSQSEANSKIDSSQESSNDALEAINKLTYDSGVSASNSPDVVRASSEVSQIDLNRLDNAITIQLGIEMEKIQAQANDVTQIRTELDTISTCLEELGKRDDLPSVKTIILKKHITSIVSKAMTTAEELLDMYKTQEQNIDYKNDVEASSLPRDILIKSMPEHQDSPSPKKNYGKTASVDFQGGIVKMAMEREDVRNKVKVDGPEGLLRAKIWCPDSVHHLPITPEKTSKKQLDFERRNVQMVTSKPDNSLILVADPCTTKPTIAVSKSLPDQDKQDVIPEMAGHPQHQTGIISDGEPDETNISRQVVDEISVQSHSQTSSTLLIQVVQDVSPEMVAGHFQDQTGIVSHSSSVLGNMNSTQVLDIPKTRNRVKKYIQPDQNEQDVSPEMMAGHMHRQAGIISGIVDSVMK